MPSNRLYSDINELCTVKALANLNNIEFKYTGDLDKLFAKVDKTDNAVIYNVSNAVAMADKIFSHFGRATKVIWTGRTGSKTKEDIVVIGKNKTYLYSLKSLKSNTGKGTDKNFGSNTIEDIFGVSICEEIDEMRKGVAEYLGQPADSSFSALKKYAKEKGIRKEVGEFANTYIERINGLLFASNNLTPQKLNEVLDNTIDNLYVIVANNGRVTIENSNDSIIPENAKVELSRSSKSGIIISIDGKESYRINTCCTNGKGLSQVCQRWFQI